MVKDIHVQKVDLRVPLEIFGKIEEIAIKTNQPFTPRSKNTNNPKPVVTSVILKALELALGKLENELIEELSEGKALTNPIISDSLEDRIFKRLEVRLEAKLDELIEVRIERLTADTPEFKEDLSEFPENNESAIEPNETIEVITPEFKEVKEVSALEDNSEMIEGLTLELLSHRLGYKNHSTLGSKISKVNKNELTKEDFIQWVISKDPEGIAWYRTKENDKKFYPL